MLLYWAIIAWLPPVSCCRLTLPDDPGDSCWNSCCWVIFLPLPMRASSWSNTCGRGMCAPVPAWSGVFLIPIIIMFMDVWGLYRLAIAAALDEPLAIGLAMFAAPM